MTLDTMPNVPLTAPMNDCGGSLDSPPQSCGCYSWHVIIVKHGQREIAELSLACDGWKTFFPLMLDTRHGSRLVPLFGAYNFVQIRHGDIGWPRIYGSRGIFTMLSRDRVPLPLPAGVVEDLQARTSARRVVDDPGENPEASRMRVGALGRSYRARGRVGRASAPSAAATASRCS